MCKDNEEGLVLVSGVQSICPESAPSSLNEEFSSLIKQNAACTYLFLCVSLHIMDLHCTLLHIVAHHCTLLHLVAPCCTLLHIVACCCTLLCVVAHCCTSIRKSFYFVCACNRQCLDVKRDQSEMQRQAPFPCSPLAVGAFPFSLRNPIPPTSYPAAAGLVHMFCTCIPVRNPQTLRCREWLDHQAHSCLRSNRSCRQFLNRWSYLLHTYY